VATGVADEPGRWGEEWWREERAAELRPDSTESDTSTRFDEALKKATEEMALKAAEDEAAARQIEELAKASESSETSDPDAETVEPASGAGVSDGDSQRRSRTSEEMVGLLKARKKLPTKVKPNPKDVAEAYKDVSEDERRK
jgi:hypothetical protein